MKNVSQTLLDNLKTKQLYKVDLYTFDLSGGGGTLRYCSGNSDITANGITFPASGTFGSNAAVGGPYFDVEDNRFKLHQKIGLEVDTFSFDVIPGAALVDGVPFLTACRTGIFDNAVMTVERAFMTTYGDTSAGTIIIFKGRIGAVQIGRSLATFTVNAYLEILNADLPRNVYQAACTNTLGDIVCQVNLANYAENFVDRGGSIPSQVSVSLGNTTQGYYNQGRITYTTGANAGLTRTIANTFNGATLIIALVGTFPYAPQQGDLATITPGCDKSVDSNGCPKFNNLARFRGFRFIPHPATAF